MKDRRIVLLLPLGILVLALTAPYWLPLKGLIPRVEQEASKALGVGVVVGKIRVHFLPTPRISFHGIRIGKPSVAELAKVVVVPQIFSLWREVKVIRLVVVESPEVQPEVFAAFGAVQKKEGARKSRVEVRQIEITKGSIRFPNFTLSDLGLSVDFGQGNSLQQANLSHRGVDFSMTFTPKQDHYAVNAVAVRWKLPAGPPIEITKLEAKGKLSATGLDVHDLNASLYGGKLTGDATLRWRRGMQLKGSFKGDQIKLEPLLAAVKSNARLGGQIQAEGQFSGEGRTGAALGDGLVVTADFNIQQGILRGVDLMNSVKGLLGSNAKPGDTKFDQLKGHVETGEAGARFTDLYIESGLMKASGDVSVAKDKTLDGDVRVDLKGTASLIGTPELAVYGTTDSPRIYPSKAAMAGAALGTAVLGPGVGTTLGMKASELAKKLFRGGSKKDARKDAPPQAKPSRQ